MLHPWDKPVQGCWNEQAVWIYSGMWVGGISGGGPVSIGLPTSEKL